MTRADRDAAILSALDRLGPSTLHKLGEELGIYQNNVFAAVNRVAGMQPIGPLLARIVDKLGG